MCLINLLVIKRRYDLGRCLIHIYFWKSTCRIHETASNCDVCMLPTKRISVHNCILGQGMASPGLSLLAAAMAYDGAVVAVADADGVDRASS